MTRALTAAEGVVVRPELLKEKISASMQEGMGLVQENVSPDPARIQAAKDAGRLTLAPPDAQDGIRATPAVGFARTTTQLWRQP